MKENRKIKLFCIYYRVHASRLLQIISYLFISCTHRQYWQQDLNHFTVEITRGDPKSYANRFFSHTSALWNCLLVSCFSVNFKLQKSKCDVNRYRLSSQFPLFNFIYHLNNVIPIFFIRSNPLRVIGFIALLVGK